MHDSETLRYLSMPCLDNLKQQLEHEPTSDTVRIADVFLAVATSLTPVVVHFRNSVVRYPSYPDQRRDDG